jgi:hypothetical protein
MCNSSPRDNAVWQKYTGGFKQSQATPAWPSARTYRHTKGQQCHAP